MFIATRVQLKAPPNRWRIFSSIQSILAPRAAQTILLPSGGQYTHPSSRCTNIMNARAWSQDSTGGTRGGR
jgi:hypothetical protein